MISVHDVMKHWLHTYPADMGTPSVGEIAEKAAELAFRNNRELRTVVKELIKSNERLEDCIANLNLIKMRRFNSDECWVWDAENEAVNYVESLTCPVVIRAPDLRRILAERDALKAHNNFAKLGRLINEQNNRCTADPLFVVFSKRESVVEEGYGHDYISWYHDDEGYAVDSETRIRRLEALHEGGRDIERYRRLAIKEVDHFETACFTEQGCKDYLAIQGHNLRKPFIYTTSLFRNEEMKTLRNWMIQQAETASE